MRVYLDNCSFNKPFDEQTQPRTRLETEAKLCIQNGVQAGTLELAWSADYFVTTDDRILNRNVDVDGIEIVDPTELVRRLNP